MLYHFFVCLLYRLGVLGCCCLYLLNIYYSSLPLAFHLLLILPPFFFCFLVFCFFVFVLLFFHLCLPAPFAMVQRLHRQIIIINNVVIMY
ncbi:hypothetical protein TB927.1.2310 [Trypanosoma brucei brucei TREU927]|uniref:T. brucei spp.-specific protein n=1 Tax=Trypanosoma brucei brucei (strain 927/4 GUTat10.1) TaxID=185431 RepID=Q4GYZ0_TRYB2|nr:hypothetical protein TB927.1.2310 [Trypanosoma brucei brucei TREU927]CAJ16347.1 hypothetical protein TB927.1.2310 [Trypanosoma brucei brucei TREU927]